MTSQQQDWRGDPYAAFRYGATHKVAYTDTAGTIASGVSNACELVLVWASTDCHIAIGTAPTATVNDKPVTAKVDTPVVVNPNDKVSAIRQASNGTLYVTELL